MPKSNTTLLRTKRSRTLAVWIPVALIYEVVAFASMAWKVAIACNATVVVLVGLLWVFMKLGAWAERGEDV
jgi:hypothetical protein